MGYNCVYPRCDNKCKSIRLRSLSQTHPGKMTFHRFPMFEPDRLKLWLFALGKDVNTSMDRISVWRICSEHFSPDDFKDTQGKVLLKSSAVPAFFSRQIEDHQIDPSQIKQHDTDTDQETDQEFLGAEIGWEDAPQSTPQKQINTGVKRTLGQRDQSHKIPILLLRSPESSEQCSHPSTSGTYYGLPPVRSLHLGKGEERYIGQEDLELKKEATGLEENEEEDVDGKIIAQSSEELVITKIEEIENETPIEMDQTESYKGKMELDECEYAASTVDKNVKNRITEQPAGTLTMSLFKHGTKLQVPQPSEALFVKINNEPMDEEYEQASELQGSVGNIKDEPDTAESHSHEMNLTDPIHKLCSDGCVTVQTLSSLGAPVECSSCKLKLVPQYHLAMSDGTIHNFCSFSCVVTYQENTVTSTSVSISVPKPAAPKPTPTETSSTTKINNQSGQVPRIHCAQCLHLFFHKPELLEYKRKTYILCDSTCVEEFRMTNNIMARCEYCKIEKLVKEVERINKTDHAFCSEECKLLYRHDLVKRWGKKHCRSCLYCKGISRTPVFGVIANKQLEFCGSDCLSKYTSLLNQVTKCTTCNQAKKITESVKWQGEFKHFCSLRCLVFFCSLRCLTGTVNKAAAKPPPTQGTTQASSAVPQSTVNCSSLGPKEATPVIANFLSLSNAANGQQGSVPASTLNVAGHASTQMDTVKTTAPPPRILKNKALMCKPLSQTKGTSCKPDVCTVTTQTDDSPSVIVLPVPVPVYVPVPMNLYTQYTPRPVGLPLPVPVPLFFPTTLDSAERIVKTIQKIKEKIPNDPLEAELIMMAEMVAEDTEKEKQITSNDETSSLMEDLDLEALSSNLNWEEDTLSSTQTWDQSSVLDRQPPSNSLTLTSATTQAEEPQMDLEADFPVESIEHMRQQTQEEQQTTDLVRQRSHRRARDGLPQKKRARKRAAAEVVTSAPNSLLNLSKLHHEYGVNAWRDWVHWRNAQPNMETPRFGSRSMTLKEDLLQCSTAELSYGLCKFISEVRRPSGEKYSPDSIFYLCLGIQQHLFENDRMENIFADIFYSRFCQGITSILKEWKPTVLPSGYVHSRVEEEYLWECKQLGAFSPSVLLNTLLYFITKFFNYRTVEQHRRLSFSHAKCFSRGQGTSKVACLRFYPPKEDTSTGDVPAKKRKKDDDDDTEGMLELKENLENPLRCPVRLYEFYLSKCSPNVRQCTNLFYLSPERSCVPNSPIWFSSTSLSDEALDSMLTRILTVRELHLQPDESPSEVNSDSESN